MQTRTFSLIFMVFTMASLNAYAATKHPHTYSQSELQAMDTNRDAMVTKDEFLSYSEATFNEMSINNGVLMLHKRASKPAEGNASSMNNQPMGTTNGKEEVNERDAVNGKKY